VLLLRIVAKTLLFLVLLLSFGAPGATGQTEPTIVLEKDGRVSASINGKPLHEVLQAFSNATGVEIIVTGPADEPITADFEPAPPDEAIRAILGQRSSICFYSKDDATDGSADRKLTEVWVFKGVARPQQKAPPKKRARTSRGRGDPFEALKRQALTDKDPERRKSAIEALIEADDKKAKSALVQALLNDKNAEVREAALENLLWYDEEAPRQALIKAALRDESTEIRRMAIEEALVDQAEEDRSARRILIQAMSDQDVDIRLTVLEALSNVALFDEQDMAVRKAITAAMRDQDEKIRLAAVESLEDNLMADELENAAENDPSDQIRKAAREAVDRISAE
jgi:hypothetical protein